MTSSYDQWKTRSPDDERDGRARYPACESCNRAEGHWYEAVSNRWLCDDCSEDEARDEGEHLTEEDMAELERAILEEIER